MTNLEQHHRQFGRTITHHIRQWETYDDFIARTNALEADEAAAYADRIVEPFTPMERVDAAAKATAAYADMHPGNTALAGLAMRCEAVRGVAVATASSPGADLYAVYAADKADQFATDAARIAHSIDDDGAT